MRDPAELWKLRERQLEKARKSARRGEPEGLHDLRVALRRVSATASALGRKKVARSAKRIVRSLSKQRQLEVDRRLLARVAQLGFLSPEVAAALAARWEKLGVRGQRRLARASDGRAVRRVKRRLDRLAGEDAVGILERLERTRRRAEEAIAHPLDGKEDRALHRYRIGVKKARYLAEDLAALGLPEWKSRAERERAVQEALGRWNDLRMFRDRLAVSRDEAEERGAIVLAGKLEHLLVTLEPTIASARRAAVDASRTTASVVPMKRVSGDG